MKSYHLFLMIGFIIGPNMIKASPHLPTALITVHGQQSDQGIKALHTQSLSGRVDDWNAYLEFSGEKTTGYKGIFEFNINQTIKTHDKLSLNIHYKGPTPPVQEWYWSIKDSCQKKWSRIGNNQHIQPWYWTPLSFPIFGDARCYLQNNKIQIQYHANNSNDASQIDYIALDITPITKSNLWLPKPLTDWQWQLQGQLNLTIDVPVYDIDLLDVPANIIKKLHEKGRKVICYFSAGSWEAWRNDAAAFPKSVIGKPLADWPGEHWLDIRKIKQLGPIMEARINLAANKGCHGIEPDNIDGYTQKSGFKISYQDQLNYNRWLAQTAHKYGLSIGLKNDLDQVKDLVNDFDWALNEQCFHFNECQYLMPFIKAGKAVFGVEYQGNPEVFCPIANKMQFSWLFKKKKLDAWKISCQHLNPLPLVKKKHPPTKTR